MIFTTVILFIYIAGMYGSSNYLIEGKSVNSTTFIKNWKKYFFSTLGYKLLYGLAFGFIMMFPRMIYTLAVKKVSYPNIPMIGSILGILIFQAIFILLTILNVVDKKPKGYIQKNYRKLLIFSLITCVLKLIPVAGQFLYLILNGFYPLLILSMYNDIESNKYNLSTIQYINNNDLLK